MRSCLFDIDGEGRGVFGGVALFFCRDRFSKLERIRKEGAGRVMDEGREAAGEDGGKERERRGVSRRGVGDDESVRRRDADRSSSARSQLDGGKHERMTLEHVYVSRR